MPQYRFGQPEHSRHFTHHRRLRAQRHHDVEALAFALDVIGEPPLRPSLWLIDFGALILCDLDKTLEGFGDLLFGESGVKNVDDLVSAQWAYPFLWSARSSVSAAHGERRAAKRKTSSEKSYRLALQAAPQWGRKGWRVSLPRACVIQATNIGREQPGRARPPGDFPQPLNYSTGNVYRATPCALARHVRSSAATGSAGPRRRLGIDPAAVARNDKAAWSVMPGRGSTLLVRPTGVEPARGTPPLGPQPSASAIPPRPHV
jgi:hypothetical protein